MEASGLSSFSRNRRLGVLFEAGFQASGQPEPRPEVGDEDEVAARRQRVAAAEGSAFEDDDRWVTVLVSVVRIVACFVTMMATTFVWALIMLVLLPWPYARVRQGNLYGHLTGWLMIIWYPLFGQLYVLANHLRIDRSNPTAAIESVKEAARAIVKNNLSLIIFPEGTRSRTGRLLPFKKGFVHVAMQSRLPIVPMVVTGTHLAWRKNSLRVRPAPLTVKFLPPIKTNAWESGKVGEYVEMVHSLYVSHLPKSQQPASSSSSGDGKDS